MTDTEHAEPAAPVPTIVPPGDAELHVGDPVVEIEPTETETHPESAANTAGAASDANDGSEAAASGDEQTAEMAAAAAAELDANPGPAGDAAMGQTAPPLPPLLGVLIHDMGDGTAGIHAIEPDGTEHAITMPTAHGALIAFMDWIRQRLPELGKRATAWTVKKPGDEEEPAEPPVAA